MATLHTRYLLTDTGIDAIKYVVAVNGQTERTFQLQWVDTTGIVHAEMERLCYIADKAHYERRKADRQLSRFNR